ncbi:hypothetical protein CPB84DRAFT_1841785 [Gymnopilus junonius]|uniref:Uncharacterized protein n=1 Tax=Gymnopilus junonius TaxID=109634 RepID=A0A9P5TTW8_GYMJU|nr:hypothetical protein CPB84DRAFT_1841785 [Gymnopilus junonius]
MSSVEAPSVLNIHTPTSSFSLVHSLTRETLLDLYDKLSRKHNTDYYGERVGPGWLKYEYNDGIWNLDDDSDYTIFTWREQQQADDQMSAAWTPDAEGRPAASTSQTLLGSPVPNTRTLTPTLHLRDPRKPLPTAPAYTNPAYYVFRPSRAQSPAMRRSPAPSYASTSKRSKKGKNKVEDDPVPILKEQFEKFHAENGVRTVTGAIGPVQNVRMLLKQGYRHVYMSRKFAIKHGFIPSDAAPGSYGYGGLVNIGKYPITLKPSASQPNLPQGYQRPDAFRSDLPSSHPHHSHSPSRIPDSPLPSRDKLVPPLINGKVKSTRSISKKPKQPDKEQSLALGKPVMVDVYLSEEPHFDVVLGRSFLEKRQVKMNSVDPTDVVCLDTGEKIECELVILKDGRGKIVTVT